MIKLIDNSIIRCSVSDGANAQPTETFDCCHVRLIDPLAKQVSQSPSKEF